MLCSKYLVKNMSSDDELTKYVPFSNKRMIAFALNAPILATLWGLRNWIQLYAAKALGIPFIYLLIKPEL